jgi:hypothetical protein
MSPESTAVVARVIAEVPAFRSELVPDMAAVEATRDVA